MSNSRAEEVAFPSDSRESRTFAGLSKRELACIELRIPETDDAQLNDLIAKAQRRDLAKAAMQGILTHGVPLSDITEDGKFMQLLPDGEPQRLCAESAMKFADALLVELEKKAAIKSDFDKDAKVYDQQAKEDWDKTCEEVNENNP